MKWLNIYRRGKQLEAEEIAFRKGWTDAIARKAVKAGLHHFIARRPIDWFRKQLDEAEKHGEKYVTLAELMLEIEKENKEIL